MLVPTPEMVDSGQAITLIPPFQRFHGELVVEETHEKGHGLFFKPSASGRAILTDTALCPYGGEINMEEESNYTYAEDI